MVALGGRCRPGDCTVAAAPGRGGGEGRTGRFGPHHRRSAAPTGGAGEPPPSCRPHPRALRAGCRPGPVSCCRSPGLPAVPTLGDGRCCAAEWAL